MVGAGIHSVEDKVSFGVVFRVMLVAKVMWANVKSIILY